MSTSEELLSAMMDGECTRGEATRVLQDIAASPALGERWSRMCLVREAMEGTRVTEVPQDFCSGVMIAIKHEGGGTVRRLPLQQQRARPRSLGWRPLAALAAAASVATVLLLGGYRLEQSGGRAQAPAVTAALVPAGASAASATGSLQARLVPVSASSAANEPVETPWSQLDAQTERQLDEFLMEHGSLREAQGLGGAFTSSAPSPHTAEFRTSEPR